MNNPTQTETELELADRTELVEKYEALSTLMDESTLHGKAFKQVVLDGYLKNEAARLTSLLAEPSMHNYRSQLFESLAAISHFEQYLNTIEYLGAPSIEDDDETNDEE